MLLGSPMSQCVSQFLYGNMPWEISEISVKGNRVTWEIFSSIRKLWLRGVHATKYLCGPIQYLTSLEELHIDCCEELELAAEGVDSIKFETLTSLKEVVFYNLHGHVTLPEWLQQITTLRNLNVFACRNLKTIPDWICGFSSLRELIIRDCPEIESLPRSISSLTSLQHLHIVGSPILLKRYRKETGKDWPEIKHIPTVFLW